ncbi:MAG TPA: TIR domain-containing protein [Thermoanaerobaculia bacterium]|jgi:hypothetical protein|nr:TIR domain-containing protein [Thermoanaerobaculia bacterium]
MAAYQIALSFAGEQRPLVSAVAERLASTLGRDKVFYDRFHEAELTRLNLDVYLQEIYHDRSRLVVVFLSEDYEVKEWCVPEWRAIRDLIKSGSSEKIMLIRVDDAAVSGVFGIDGWLDARGKSANEIAHRILERLHRLDASPGPPKLRAGAVPISPPPDLPRPDALAELRSSLLSPQDLGSDPADPTSITSWFETGVAYIDPDDHGPVGFALVPFLMLLYDKVVVHSPYAGQIVTAYEGLPPELQPLLLEWADLRDLACDPGSEDTPVVRITAFPNYVDASFDKTRDLEFRAIQGVDAERLDPSSDFYRSILLINEDPRPRNAEWAKAIAEDDQRFELAKRRIRDGGLPSRFVQALKGEDFFCPKDLAEWWPYAMSEQKLLALSAYDYLNDRTALAKGGGGVHCLTTAGEFAVELLFGIDDAPFRVADMENPRLQSQRVLEILQALGRELELPRIDAPFIREFRSRYRADFVRDIAGILEKIGREPDPVRRKRLTQELIRAAAKLDRFPIKLGQSLGLLLKLLPPVTLGLAKKILPDAPRQRRWRYALRKKDASPP